MMGKFASDLLRFVVRLRGWYPLPIVGVDGFAFVAGFVLMGLVSSGISWPRLFALALLGAGLFLAVGWVLKLYRNRYRVGTFDEVLFLGVTWTVSAGALLVLNKLLPSPTGPTYAIVLAMTLTGGFMGLARVAWRMLRRSESRPDPQGRKRVLVFGAGDGGVQVVKSMLGDVNSRYVPVGLLDDDDKKQNRVIEGVHVLGTRDDVKGHAAMADLLLIAVPSAGKELMSHLADQAAEADLEVMTLPSTTELFGMMVDMESARPLEITDLLHRDEVEVDAESVEAYLRGQVVLVTGAGGSIGSELCRQILRYEPAELVMLDRDETALHGVQLSVSGHGLLDDDHLVLADIRDRDRVLEVFGQHRPTIVFHAAALKHLPLLESHPREGLLTNVFGTKNVLDAAVAVGATRFVNVSTDKAANPTSVLGTTKRIAEALTLAAGQSSSGEFMSVRFGNVIGSRGSVLPTFEQQIAAGGPVTVTHPDVTRFFMSIPEASRLVLQAAAFGRTGETLILDMGEPMKIVDLAQQLIKHYKSEAEIVFTGLRPNEKLHEVLGHDGEVMEVGPHPRVWHAKTAEFLRSADPAELLRVAADDLPDALLEWCRVDEPVTQS